MDCSFPKVFSPHISTNGSKNGDQQAKEDEDIDGAEHETVADGEVDLGLEGEGGEGDDHGCSGSSCHENDLSFDEHQDQPQQQGLCNGEDSQHDEVDGDNHAESPGASHGQDDDEACSCRAHKDDPECSSITFRPQK